MKPRSLHLPFLAAAIYLFLYLPLGVVVVQSFNSSRYGVTWGGFTLQWYFSLLKNPDTIAALRNTLWLAVGSTVIATVLGTLLGYGLARHRFAGKLVLQGLLHLTVCIPDIVLAVALLLFFGTLRSAMGFVGLGLGTMIMAHVTFQLPFVALAVGARLAGTDPAVEEAAYDLGASRGQRFWYVTLPMMRPGIVAGALLAFTLSLDDFVVSFFTSGAGSTTLPILIYSSVKRGITPEIHALSTLIIVASTAATVAIMLVQKRGGTSVTPLTETNR